MTLADDAQLVPIITATAEFYDQIVAAAGPDQEPEAVVRAMAAHDAGRSSDIMAFLMEQIVTHRQVREQGFPTWDLDIDGVAYVLQYAAIGPAYSLYRERISDAEELS